MADHHLPCLAFHDYTAKTTLWHDLGPLQFKALFGKPDYSHIVRDTTATISITAAEMAAVLEAYDRGIDTLDGTTRTALDSVISKLKDEVWP